MDLSDWRHSILKPAIANGLGTLGAALLIFLVGIASGLIENVPTRVWITVGVGVLGVAAAGIAGVAHRKRRQEILQREAIEMIEELDGDTRTLFSIAYSDTSRSLTDDENRRLAEGMLAASKRAAERRK
jgi:hypothetical protein